MVYLSQCLLHIDENSKLTSESELINLIRVNNFLGANYPSWVDDLVTPKDYPSWLDDIGENHGTQQEAKHSQR